jgi:CRP-like cAMP-binding protein
MLAPLSAPVLERLAGGVIRSSQAAGDVVIRAGDAGDRYFVVADGDLAVEVDGRPARRLRRGDGFGEIAMIRAVPRTATVTATTAVTLLGIDREPFLAALTGQPRSRRLAASLVAERLSGEPVADRA